MKFLKQKWSVWEIIAHETGHHLDYIKYDRGFHFIIPPDGKELNAIERVNTLRTKLGMPIEFYKNYRW